MTNSTQWNLSASGHATASAKKNLAWHEMRLLLSAFMLYFDVELCEEGKGWNDQKVYILW